MDVAWFLMFLWLSAFVRMSCKTALVLDADFQPVQFDFILQPQMRHVDVLNYCRFHVDGECASTINTGFTAKHKSRIMLWTPFASDPPNAAAYSAASALLRRKLSPLNSCSRIRKLESIVPFKYRTSRFNLEKLCCEGSDILWQNSFTANVMSALY